MSCRSIRLLESDDETVALNREQRRKILEQFERLEKEMRELRKEQRELREENGELKRENKRLNDRIRKLESTPQMLSSSDSTAEAGGVPTSRIFYRRPRHTDRKPGGQPGHEGHGRNRPETNSAPVTISLDRCTECGSRLGEPSDSLSRTITDIPPPRAVVYELRLNRYVCPQCRSRVTAPSPLPPNMQFGPVLASHIAHMRMLGMSIGNARTMLRESHGIGLSDATVLSMEQWVASSLEQQYGRLKKNLKRHGNAGADETRLRVNGDNGWLWAIATNSSVVYRIANTRGKAVPLELLSGYTGTLCHDDWKPYNAITTAKHQLDYLHVNRWIERAEVRHGMEPRPLLGGLPAVLTRRGRPPDEFISFADGVRNILSRAVHATEKSERARKYARTVASRKLHTLLERRWKDRDAAHIAAELRRRFGMLFTFLRHRGVPWHNNRAENAIRQGVLHRKISGGRRTWNGAHVLECIMSVYRTCRKRKEDFRATVLSSLVRGGYRERITQLPVP